MKTFLHLFGAELKELIRDRMAIFWFLAFPVIFTVIFGLIFSGGGDRTFDVGLVIAEEGPVANGVRQAFESIDVFKVHIDSRETELEALKKGQRSMVIILPAAINTPDPAAGPVEVEVFYDQGQQTTNPILLPVVDQVLDGLERQITRMPRLVVPVRKPVSALKLKDIDYLLPGILAMALMQLGLFGSLHLVSLREKKILKALGATPLPRVMLLGSEVLVRLLMSVVQAAVIIILGRLLFDVHVSGPWYQVVGLVLLGAATFVSLGYMLASFSKSEESGMGLIQLVQFPMMFFSGIFFPLSVMPAFLRPLIRALPLTYLGDILRHVMVGMPAAYPVMTSLLILFGVLAVSMLITVAFWRWE